MMAMAAKEAITQKANAKGWEEIPIGKASSTIYLYRKGDTGIEVHYTRALAQVRSAKYMDEAGSHWSLGTRAGNREAVLGWMEK